MAALVDAAVVGVDGVDENNEDECDVWAAMGH